MQVTYEYVLSLKGQERALLMERVRRANPSLAAQWARRMRDEKVNERAKDPIPTTPSGIGGVTYEQVKEIFGK